MKRRLPISIILLVLSVVISKAENYRPARVSFEDFKELVAAVEPHRAKRLVSLNEFLRMSKEPNTIVLDSRSDFRYDRIHLKGALHLSFTDFTQENLRKVIPDSKTRVLIYCNNNFEGNQTDFATKVAMPSTGPLISPSAGRPTDPVAAQMQVQRKPRMMALNIPTYVNLYGYGYSNVYELGELVKVDDPRIKFEGSIVKR